MDTTKDTLVVENKKESEMTILTVIIIFFFIILLMNLAPVKSSGKKMLKASKTLTKAKIKQSKVNQKLNEKLKNRC